MIYRIDHAKQLPRARSVAQGGECHGGPDGRVRILSAVFPYSWDVSSYIAGIKIRRVEGRRQ